MITIEKGINYNSFLIETTTVIKKYMVEIISNLYVILFKYCSFVYSLYFSKLGLYRNF